MLNAAKVASRLQAPVSRDEGLALVSVYENLDPSSASAERIRKQLNELAQRLCGKAEWDLTRVAVVGPPDRLQTVRSSAT